MRPTNNLNSHCGEHRTYPADKMIPMEVIGTHRYRDVVTTGVQRKVLKAEHRSKSRNFNKKLCRDALNENERYL